GDVGPGLTRRGDQGSGWQRALPGPAHRSLTGGPNLDVEYPGQDSTASLYLHPETVGSRLGERVGEGQGAGSGERFPPMCTGHPDAPPGPAPCSPLPFSIAVNRFPSAPRTVSPGWRSAKVSAAASETVPAGCRWTNTAPSVRASMR